MANGEKHLRKELGVLSVIDMVIFCHRGYSGYPGWFEHDYA